MKTAPSDHWLFDIETEPVFIPRINGDGKTIHVPISGKRALVAADTDDVLGIVSEGYRVFTNREAGEACVRFCQEAFKDTAAGEWTLKVGHGPNTRSWVHLDIHHNTHLRNLMGIAGTDFIRRVSKEHAWAMASESQMEQISSRSHLIGARVNPPANARQRLTPAGGIAGGLP